MVTHGLNCAPTLHLNIDGAPKLKNCFYIKYGVLNLWRQFSNQIDLRLFDGKKYHDCHRSKGGLQNTAATDMRNLNKVKKILSFEFSIYGSGDKVSLLR